MSFNSLISRTDLKVSVSRLLLEFKVHQSSTSGSVKFVKINEFRSSNTFFPCASDGY